MLWERLTKNNNVTDWPRTQHCVLDFYVDYKNVQTYTLKPNASLESHRSIELRHSLYVKHSTEEWCICFPTLLQPCRKECLRLRSGVLRSWEKWRLKSAQSGKSTPKQVVRLTVCCLSTLQVYIWEWSHIHNADFALIWLELFTQYIAAYPCGFWGVCIVCCSYDFAWVWERGSKETGRDEAKPKSGE